MLKRALPLPGGHILTLVDKQQAFIGEIIHLRGIITAQAHLLLSVIPGNARHSSFPIVKHSTEVRHPCLPF